MKRGSAMISLVLALLCAFNFVYADPSRPAAEISVCERAALPDDPQENASASLNDYLLERREIRQNHHNLLQQATNSSQEDAAPVLEFVRDIDAENPITHRYEFNILRPTLYSTLGSDEINPVGSSRWIPAGLSPATAQWLGFEIRTNGTVIYPSVAYINHRIEQLNELLRRRGRRRQVNVTFYEQDGKAPQRDYLIRYYRDGQLPIARDLLEHDYNFHVGSILLPEDIITRSRAKIEYAVRWLEHTEQRIASANFTAAQNAVLNDMLLVIESRFVTSIDSGTGNFTRDFALGYDDPIWMAELVLASSDPFDRIHEAVAYQDFNLSPQTQALFESNPDSGEHEFIQMRRWLLQQNDQFLASLTTEEQERLRRELPRRVDGARRLELSATRRTVEAAAYQLLHQ